MGPTSHMCAEQSGVLEKHARLHPIQQCGAAQPAHKPAGLDASNRKVRARCSDCCLPQRSGPWAVAFGSALGLSFGCGGISPLPRQFLKSPGSPAAEPGPWSCWKLPPLRTCTSFAPACAACLQELPQPRSPRGLHCSGLRTGRNLKARPFRTGRTKLSHSKNVRSFPRLPGEEPSPSQSFPRIRRRSRSKDSRAGPCGIGRSPSGREKGCQSCSPKANGAVRRCSCRPFAEGFRRALRQVSGRAEAPVEPR